MDDSNESASGSKSKSCSFQSVCMAKSATVDMFVKNRTDYKLNVFIMEFLSHLAQFSYFFVSNRFFVTLPRIQENSTSIPCRFDRKCCLGIILTLQTGLENLRRCIICQQRDSDYVWDIIE